MKKILLWSLVLLISISMVAVFSITSCKKEAAPVEEEVVEEAPAEEEKEELVEKKKMDIEMWHWQPGENYKKALDTIIEMFKERYKDEHPEYELNIYQNISGGDEFHIALKSKGLAKELPELFGILAGAELVDNWDQVIDITDYVKGDPEWLEWAAGYIDHSEMNIDGRISMVPIDKWDVGIWYYKDIMEEVGFDLPKTIDELIALTEPIKAAGYIPISAGLSIPEQSTYLLANLAGQFGYDGLAQAENGEIKWNNPDFVKCLTAINNIYQAGMYRDDALMLRYCVEDLEDFTNHACWGFWMGGDYFAGALTPEEFENVGVLPYPLVEEDGEVCFISSIGQNFNMPNYIDEEKKEVCLDLMKFLSSPEASLVFLDNQIRPAGLVPEGTEFTNPIIKETVEKASIYKEVSPYIFDSEVLNVLGDNIDKMYIGQITPEEALQAVDDFMASR